MQSLGNPFHIHLLGDHAILIKLSKGLNEGIDQDLLALAAFIKEQKIQGVKDIILAYDNLTLVYDILDFDSNPYLYVNQLVANFIAEASNHNTLNSTSRLIEVPVCYDPSLGIDLEHAAQLASCSIDALIQLHTAEIYTVYCLGFLPGFAYMGDVPKKIQLPRREETFTSIFMPNISTKEFLQQRISL